MEKLLIATKNPGKFNELRVILGHVPYQVVSLDLLGIDGDVEEDGETYEENALKKARYFSDKVGGMLTLTDDSGLEVNALQGELGLKTRRWGAGENASDEEWLEHFLDKMNGVEDRTAKFVCCAALIGGVISNSQSPIHNLQSPTSSREVFFGEVHGEITHEPEAPLLPGLPLSSCFRPQGWDKVYAALNLEEKGALSHRGLAVSKVRSHLLGK